MWLLVLLIPSLLAFLSLLALIYLRSAKKRKIPFFDGWFVHLIILSLYAYIMSNLQIG